MKYVKQFRQETVKAENPEVFDMKMNEIFLKASLSGKDPEVHFFDGMGLCATVRYFVSETLPESISEKYQLEGHGYLCSECPYFKLPSDRRIKKVRCDRSGRLVNSQSRACDDFYVMLEEGSDEFKTKAIQ